MKTIDENKKRYKTLKVDSRGEDKLDGSHTKIAEEISACIKDDDIKIIGLEGEWGSGKSNVIKIMEKTILTEKIGYHFFTFDTWGHQEDLQRRAFLQELIEDLVEKKFIKEEWKTKKLKNLLSNKTMTEITEIPKFNSYLIFIALAYFIDKIIFANLPSGWLKFEWLTNFCAKTPLFLTILTIIKTFIEKHSAIFLVGIIIMIQKCRKKISFGELLYIFKGQTLASRLETSTSSLEPTVRDFTNWMNELSEDLKINLVIVFDNSDRLPHEKVKEIWSSFYTFFAEKTYDKIWVLVPFSASHLKKAFDSDDKNTEDNSQGFVSKTFPIVYRVTPPILKSWKDFLRDCFIKIFENDFENNFDRIEVIYNYLEKNKTPRNIILFINNLATLKNLYHEIDFDIITYYILKKDVIDEDSLLNKNVNCKDVFKFFDGSFDFGNLAALYFGTTRDNAVHILLGEQIDSALSQGDFKEMENIKHWSGFGDVLKNIIVYELENPNNAIIAMIKFDAVEPYKTIFIKLKDNILRKNFVNKIITFEEYHKILIKKLPEFEEEILRTVLSVPFENVRDEKSLSTVNVEKLYVEIFKIETFLAEKKSEISVTNLLPENIVNPVFFSDFIVVAANKLTEKYDGEYLNQKYKIQTDQNLFSESLNMRLNGFFRTNIVSAKSPADRQKEGLEFIGKIINNIDYPLVEVREAFEKYSAK